MLWDIIPGANIGEAIIAFLRSWFDYSGIEGKFIAISAVLALAFGIIWLLGYRAPFGKKPQLWLVAVFSALITVVVVAVIYLPLSYFYLSSVEPSSKFEVLLYLIPVALLSGFSQEVAKMLPMLFFLRGSDKNDPRMGLTLGAAAGAGFGIFLLFWTYNQLLGLGWGYYGIESLIPFWITFWTLAMHIGLSSFVGYGITQGKTSKYLATAGFIQALVAYLPYFFVAVTEDANTTYNILAIVIPIIVVIIMAISYNLRWRKYGGETPVIVPAAGPGASLTPPAPPIPPPAPPPAPPATPVAPPAPPLAPSPPPAVPPAAQPILESVKEPAEPEAALTPENKARLVLPDNKEIATNYPVNLIGRQDLEKFISPDYLRYVSRRHFIISTDGSRYYIEDQNSANGTKVNGVNIKGLGKRELNDGDRIDIADAVILKFKLGGT